MNFTPLTILVASAAKKVPLVRAVQHAARKLHPDMKVIAGDADENALARYVADGFWHMPRTIDNEADALLAGCKQRGISIVIPTRDGELLFWARHRAQFLDAGINVIVSPASSVEVCFDKLAFAQFGAVNGLPFIPAAEHPSDVGAGPYAVKERYGAGARKMGLNLDRTSALQHGASMEAPIYQPFMSGQEISIDAWLDQACQVKGLVLRTRDYVVNGESQVTTTFRDDAIEKEVARVLNTLKLSGSVVMQAFIDANRRIHIIECNTRIGGASTTSIAAGLDIFYWSLLETYGADLREYPFKRVCGEVRQIRVTGDIHEYGSGF
jgi:carbamoyl-phosphate synthase large subunit